MLLLTAAAYVQNLDGPLILDDEENLTEAIAFAQGRLSFTDVMHQHRAVVTGRPLSHLSFVYSALVVGTSPQAFRSVNLVLHLLCGLLVFRMISALAARDPGLADNRVWLAVMVAGLWLTAPLFVSTVLYAVQRMAQLSALFSLLALLFFIEGRERLANGGPGARSHLFLGVPLCLVSGILAKENAVVVVGLLVLIEFFFFSTKALERRAVHVLRAFFVLLVLAPLVSGAWYFATHTSSLIGGYSLRHFSLGERLLTEPRVLWDYAGALLLPSGSRLGLIHDDYAISRGLLSPISTLPAIIAWAGLLTVSFVKLRHSRPCIPFGLAFFLLAHSLESSFLPLEIYFEHRNYLPAVGLYLAAAVATVGLAEKFPYGQVIVRAIAIAIIPIFLVSTTLRAIPWRVHIATLILALEEHPDSPRLLSSTAALLAARGNTERALELARHAAAVAPDQRAAMLMLQLGIYCTSDQMTPETLFGEMNSLQAPTLNGSLLYQFRALTALAHGDHCEPRDLVRVSDKMTAWIEHNSAYEHDSRIAVFTNVLGRLLIAQNRDREALDKLESAIKLQPSVPERYFLLADQYLRVGDRASAKLAFQAGEHRLPPASRRFEQIRFAIRFRLGLPPYDQSSQELRKY